MQKPVSAADLTALSVSELTPELWAEFVRRLGTAESKASEATENMKAQEHMIMVMTVEIESLRTQVARLRRTQFGPSSEKLLAQLGQLELNLESLETCQSFAQAGLDEALKQAGLSPANTDDQSTEAKSPRTPRTRKAIPDSLPREDLVHEAAGVDTALNCTTCGNTAKRVGEDITEQLEYQPASFKVIRHIRPKYACTCCGTLSQAPSTGKLIEKGMAGSGLLAHVAVSKYCDHLPLYRQSEMIARQGIELDRATLANWMGKLGFMLQPVVDAIKRHVFEAKKVHADDTTMPMLKPGNQKTVTGRLWTYVRNDCNSGDTKPPAIWFAWSDNRRAENPAEHLKGYKGWVQCDAYAGYNGSFEQHGLSPAFCWAHARRKFFDLAKQFKGNGTNMAQQAIERIAVLYAIEQEIRTQPPDERLRIRQEKSAPKLEEFRSWALDCLTRLSKKSQTAEAFLYILSRWEGFIAYCKNGHLEIDNNWAENSVRPIALGRKNYLFVGSEKGGVTAANLYTLIGTAKANGIDPFAYLRLVITCIANGHKITEINQLLPWNSKAQLTA